MKSTIENLIHIITTMITSFMINKFGISYSLSSLVQTTFDDIIYEGFTYAKNITAEYDNLFNLFNDDYNVDGDIKEYILIIIFLFISIYMSLKLFKLFNNNIIKYIINLIDNNYYFNKFLIIFKENILHIYAAKTFNPDEIHKILNYLYNNNIYINNYDKRYKFMELNSKNNNYLLKYHKENENNDININYKLINKIIAPDVYKKLYICDNNFNINGYVYIRINNMEITVEEEKVQTNSEAKTKDIVTSYKTINVCVPILELYINKNAKKYLNNVLTYEQINYECYAVNNLRSSMKSSLIANIKKINKICLNSNVNYKEYIKDNITEYEDKYIKTLFHPYRDEIWNYIKNVIFYPDKIINLGQYPQYSMCLYGPPGTGKSSFAYRVAMATGSHVVTLNLSRINKYELHDILNNKFTFSDTTNNDNYKISSSGNDNIIYVFDEFDHDIEYLLKVQQDIDSKKEKLYSLYKNYNKINKVNNNDNINGDNINGDNKKDNNNENKINNIYKEINKLENDIDSNDKITLNDLLILIQGVCYSMNRIIIATTNKYNHLRDVCPRLFRDGRFKPIHFGYPSKETINEITEYYYSKKIYEDHEKDEIIKLPISKIIDSIISTNLLHEGNKDLQFNIFNDNLEYYIKNYKLVDKFLDYEEIHE